MIAVSGLRADGVRRLVTLARVLRAELESQQGEVDGGTAGLVTFMVEVAHARLTSEEPNPEATRMVEDLEYLRYTGQLMTWPSPTQEQIAALAGVDDAVRRRDAFAELLKTSQGAQHTRVEKALNHWTAVALQRGWVYMAEHALADIQYPETTGNEHQHDEALAVQFLARADEEAAAAEAHARGLPEGYVDRELPSAEPDVSTVLERIVVSRRLAATMDAPEQDKERRVLHRHAADLEGALLANETARVTGEAGVHAVSFDSFHRAADARAGTRTGLPHPELVAKTAEQAEAIVKAFGPLPAEGAQEAVAKVTAGFGRALKRYAKQVLDRAQDGTSDLPSQDRLDLLTSHPEYADAVAALPPFVASSSLAALDADSPPVSPRKAPGAAASRSTPGKRTTPGLTRSAAGKTNEVRGQSPP